MTDINRDRAAEAVATAPDGTAGAGRAAVREGAHLSRHDALLTYVELLFFAYRDFTGDPDSILQQLGFGRAHHRVLHFVRRYPGLRVAELLQILKITKQSFSRVLRDLVVSGHIERRTGPSDRRERLLFATVKGAALADRLARPQVERIAAALASLDGGRDSDVPALPAAHHEAAQKFLYLMINAQDRGAVDALMRRRIAVPLTERPQQAGSLAAAAKTGGTGSSVQSSRQRKGTA